MSDQPVSKGMSQFVSEVVSLVTSEKVAALIALGSERLRTVDLGLTHAELTLLARRALILEAKHGERAEVLEQERLAMQEREEREDGARSALLAEYRRIEGSPNFGFHTASWKDLERQYVKEGMSKGLRERIARDADNAVEWAKRSEELESKKWSDLSRIMRESADRMIEAKAAEVGMEWAAPLLTSTFALPDGSRVEWGAATVEQHAARAEMFAKNAAANAEGAVRHRVAIRDITEAGVTCLNEVVQTSD